MAGVLLVVLLLVGLTAQAVLYDLVRAEHDNRQELPREDAERVARRDLDDER